MCWTREDHNSGSRARFCSGITFRKSWRRPLPPFELRLALFHESLPSFAEILRVHAGGRDFLDRGHLALVLVFENLRNRKLAGLDREWRIAGDGAGDLERFVP